MHRSGKKDESRDSKQGFFLDIDQNENKNLGGIASSPTFLLTHW